MPLILALNLVVQLCFIVHVYRSGAPRYWAFVILMFPVAGCIAYYFIEVFPHSREARAARRTARNLSRAIDPAKELRARAADVALCGSVDNRTALAEECITAGIPEEAVKLYRSCLSGAYENDPHLLFGLARALVEQGASDEAADVITQLRKAHPCHKPNEARLLHARILELRSETEFALAEYRELTAVYVGLEARCRYGMLLDRLGRHADARAVFQETVAQAKRTGALIDAEAEWAKVARQRAAAPR
jgi:hypothetical protein